MFDRYLTLWNLIPDGDPITTPAARLLPVVRGGEPAMLKISHEEDERFGGVLMEWWDGEGAARVLARENEALLLKLLRARPLSVKWPGRGAMTKPAAFYALPLPGCTHQGRSRILT
jgi:streptomycin 6-kinase